MLKKSKDKEEGRAADTHAIAPVLLLLSSFYDCCRARSETSSALHVSAAPLSLSFLSLSPADAASCSTYCVLTRFSAVARQLPVRTRFCGTRVLAVRCTVFSFNVSFVPASVANRRHTRAMSRRGGRSKVSVL
jgi:hypothetical protein